MNAAIRQLYAAEQDRQFLRAIQPVEETNCRRLALVPATFMNHAGNVVPSYLTSTRSMFG